MNISSILIGALAGLAWGGLCAWINTLILKKAMTKKDANAITAANLARLTVDALALLAVFLLRKFLPFSYEVMMIATALALSAVTLVFAFRFSKKK
jgi:uncharacterized membrane protein YdfJ with MMPL/SSD domain